MIRLFEILFLVLIIVITWIHAKRFAQNKPIGPWFHFVWGCVYFIPVIFFAWQLHSWWLAGAATLERFVFYNPILNYQRIPRMNWFYIHSGKNGSWWDDLELLWAKAYPWAWGLAALGFIIIQFIL